MKYIFLGLAVLGMVLHASPKVDTKGIGRQLCLLALVILMFLCANWWSK
jgi:hypothetical protein